jgi:hypothetical protein
MDELEADYISIRNRIARADAEGLSTSVLEEQLLTNQNQIMDYQIENNDCVSS